MLNIITIFCLFTLQAISPLNSFIMYPYKLFLLTELFINNTLLAQINNYALPLLSPSSRPLSRISLLQNPTIGASIEEPRALTYTLRTAYISYAQVYHLLTPSTLTINRATSYRLLKYIHLIAIAPSSHNITLRLFYY